MFRLITLACILIFSINCLSQSKDMSNYAVSEKYPYGKKNPRAPQQLDDFKSMIGTSHCKSLRRNPDQTWADTTNLIWSFKYILNGTAIQDETWSDKAYATSVRQYHSDSMRWVVSYNSYPGVSLKGAVWTGNMEDKDIVLEQPQKAPNGMDGISRLTFTNISLEGFHWKGEWVNEQQNIVYPFWLIWCTKESNNK